MGIHYCTREDVKASLDAAETARTNAQVDRLIERASRAVEGLCHRRFHPERATRVFDWPADRLGPSWRLWLGEDELLSLDTITSDGVDITAGTFLEPQRSGPPYSRLDIDMAGDGAYTYGQRTISITGVFGYCGDTQQVAELDGVVGSSDTTMTVDDASLIGVGSLLLLDSEYVQVTGRLMSDTGQTLAADLAPNPSGVVLTVQDGTEFAPDELILVDGERMRVVDTTPFGLVVQRAWDGSPLAAHATGATVYAARTLRIARGRAGTQTAAHAGGPVRAHVVPGPIRDLTIAETLVGLGREQSGYARTIGTGDIARSAPMTDLRDLRRQVFAQYGRVRTGAV